ncbi:MAG: hypothetical protein KA198_07030 [Chitinophagaceae bacterium]|nr:hypothetical protein [Chitinophagaceae bacterium]
MKYQKMKFGLIILALGTSLIFNACRKTTSSKDNDTETAKDNALGDFVYSDALNIADDASTVNSGDNLGSYKTSSNCAVVTHDTLSTPKTITVDFGPVNCLCNDGRNRRGKILVSYTGKYRDAGHLHTITFDNYFVNDNQVLGSKSVTNMGLNTSGQTYFNIVVNGLIIRATTLDSVIWNSNRTRTWTQGESTMTRADDVYDITGNGSGQRANGTAYTMTITQALVRAVACSWIQSGKIDLQPANRPLRQIDFGTGGCDNQATVTINNVTYNITLN